MIIASLPFVLAELTLGSILEKVITTGVIAGIVSLIAIPVLKNQIKDLAKALERFGESLADHEKRINSLAIDRTQCELRASKSYATREDFAHLLVENSSGQREISTKLDDMASSFRDSVGKVHKRVDDLAQTVARMEGRQDKNV